MSEARVHMRISGKVQGVAFRYNTKDEADSLGVVGWVRNVQDGTVEIVAEGEKSALEKFVGWAKQGPPVARVSNLDADWQEPTGEFDRFFVARTA